MRPFLPWLIAASLLLTPGFFRPAEQNASPTVHIRQPVGGEALQGTVSIIGNANPVGFQSYEIAFAYSGDTTGTWFLIAEGDQPVRNTVLAEWDSFAITDGSYDLRLLVTLGDGSRLEDRVEGLRVRNYSLVETSTPEPAPTASLTPTMDLTANFTPSASPTLQPSPSPLPSGTPLPPNPAELRPSSITQSMLRAASGVLAAFLLAGLYASLRKAGRR